MLNTDRLYFLRNNKRWTQVQTAEKLGMSDTSYRRLENGERQPNAVELENLAGLFGVTADDLLSSGNFLTLHNTQQNSDNVLAPQGIVHYHNYYGSDMVFAETEKLKQLLVHHDETIARLEKMLEEKDKLLEEKNGEILFLRNLTQIKKNS